MTIALSANTTWYLYNFRSGLIKALLARDERVVVIAPLDEYSARLERMGVEVIDLPMDNKGANPARDAMLLFAYIRLYRQLRPHLVLHNTIKPVIYGSLAARSLGVPFLNTITGLGTTFIREDWMTRVVERLYRISQRRASQVFFQNNDDLELFRHRRLVPQERVQCLPGSGVNLTHFSVKPSSQGEPCFLLIARLLRDKGICEFVEAARKIRRKYPRARFQLLGQLGVANRTAITREELESWLAEGVVEYLGETDDVRPFIAQAHCVVLPSYREGLPRSLLEAGAMGRPLITTDAPGCREVVQDGENGYLCRLKDAEDLAEKILAFLKLSFDERCKMGLLSREKVSGEFDETIVIERYLEAADRYRLSEKIA